MANSRNTHGSCKDPGCLSCREGQAGLTAKLARDLEDPGWSVMMVPNGIKKTGNPALRGAGGMFAYTVGLTVKGMPELYCEFPLRAMQQHWFNAVNNVAASAVFRGLRLHGSLEIRNDSDGTVWHLHPATDAQRDKMGMVHGMFGDDFEALWLTRHGSFVPGTPDPV